MMFLDRPVTIHIPSMDKNGDKLCSGLRDHVIGSWRSQFENLGFVIESVVSRRMNGSVDTNVTALKGYVKSGPAGDQQIEALIRVATVMRGLLNQDAVVMELNNGVFMI